MIILGENDRKPDGRWQRKDDAEAAASLKAQLRESPSDAVAIARWCIGGIEKQPQRWANRFHWIHREARLVVARHCQEIVEVAAGLFSRGIMTLSGGGERDRKC